MAAKLRPIGFGMIAGGALAVWLLMAPPVVAGPTFDLSVQDYTSMVTQALDDAETNEILADSAH